MRHWRNARIALLSSAWNPIDLITITFIAAPVSGSNAIRKTPFPTCPAFLSQKGYSGATILTISRCQGISRPRGVVTVFPSNVTARLGPFGPTHTVVAPKAACDAIALNRTRQISTMKWARRDFTKFIGQLDEETEIIPAIRPFAWRVSDRCRSLRV
jgi:hypothetical protein